MQGRVLIIDDVISAGTSVRESIDLIVKAGATPAGVTIALDRQEKPQPTAKTPTKAPCNRWNSITNCRLFLSRLWPICCNICNRRQTRAQRQLPAVLAYRQRYGV